MMSSNNNSCVETPDAPDWLSKLEDRRQKLAQSKLGHELGQGAQCDECDKCPGLDLHFWRKVCRNCKCRKDQHRCNDDDMLSGWAQFEILGQIRSKPAFIKIKELATQPVQLEWVPPNATPDVISDYMQKLGKSKIPLAGSTAAQKRKQQLEFQVPPHDLDAGLCDNLSDSEAKQMLQYVQKIRENCVGQGNVVRVGDLEHALIGRVGNQGVMMNNFNMTKHKYLKFMTLINEEPVADPVLADLLGSDELANVLLDDTNIGKVPKKLFAFSTPFSDSAECTEAGNVALLTGISKRNLIGPLNAQVVKSLVQNGVIYDKLLALLNEKKLDISCDPKLGLIDDFRKNYLSDAEFAKELNDVFLNNTTQSNTPLKSSFQDFQFNSPIPFKQPVQALISTQETPMRKIKFSNSTDSSSMKPSNSNDSGFESKPATPGQAGATGLDAFETPVVALEKAFSSMPVLKEPNIVGMNKNQAVPAPNSDKRELKIREPLPRMANLFEHKSTAALICRDCVQPIFVGEVAVKAHRAGRDIAWHPECFKCATCRELLADLVYFFHADQIFCGRDLAIKLKIPRCKACDELIFTKEYTAAEGSTFHVKHFCCYQCDEPLAGKQYIPDDRSNMPVCLHCYELYFAAACQKCLCNIAPTDKEIVWGEIHWHTLCFNCAGVHCGKSLIGGRFCVKDNLPFCSASCVRSLND